MKKVVVFGASNSKKSINRKLAQFAGSKMTGAEIIDLDLNDWEAPLYGIDLETEKGIPANIEKLAAIFDESDGFIVSFAEHNGSYSSAFKNMFDWLSRQNGKVWREKPMFLMATSPGARGGQTVLETAAARFPWMGGKVISTFSLPGFYDNFSDENGIKGEEFSAQFLEGLKAFEEAL